MCLVNKAFECSDNEILVINWPVVLYFIKVILGLIALVVLYVWLSCRWAGKEREKDE
jgi:hypothetical protein